MRTVGYETHELSCAPLVLRRFAEVSLVSDKNSNREHGSLLVFNIGNNGKN